MPVNLNLLPPELTVSRSLNSFLKTLRALGVIAVVAFLVSSIGIGIFFIVSKMTLDSVNAKVSSLKTQVTAQEKSEQQIMLLKDRLGKIISIQALPSSLTGLNTVEQMLTGLSSNVSVSKMQIDTSGVTLSLAIGTNSDLTTFLKLVRNPDVFKTVNLTTFSLNPTDGYFVTAQMVKK